MVLLTSTLTMFMDKVLRSWEDCREKENFSPFIEVVKSTIHAGVNDGDIYSVSDTKTFNSILSAACSDNYPTSVQKAVLDLIQFLGSSISMRYRLINTFFILKTLVYGLSSKPAGPEQLKLLKAVQLFTIDLHHLCPSPEPEVFSYTLKYMLRLVSQCKQDDEFLEPALGVLANLSRFTELVQAHLINKSDFERLRKCLLHIMSSDSVSQSGLVFSMAIRFYLWKASDKFFEGLNVHKTLQVLFNLLLNGDISLCGLCAGELLSDICAEQDIMPLVSSFPELNDCIQEILLQLKSKDSTLVLKLIHLLCRLAGNGTNPEVGEHIRQVIFHCEATATTTIAADKQDNADMDDDERGTQKLEPLITLFALASGSDDLVASAALDFLLQIAKKQSQTEKAVPIPHELLLEHIICGMRKVCGITAFRFRTEPSPDHCLHQHAGGSSLCGRLVRCLLFVRLASEIVDQLQQANKTELSVPPLLMTSSVLIDHLSVLAEFLHQMVVGQLNGNPLVSLFTRYTSAHAVPEDLSATAFNSLLDIGSCLVSVSLVLEGMGLIHAIAELVSILAPSASQDEEVSVTQEDGIDGSGTRLAGNKAIPTAAQQCGQSLQSLLERSEVPGLFALGLLTTSRHLITSSNYLPLGMGPASRQAVIRLLGTALHWDGFDNDQFIYQLNRLQLGNPTSGSNLSELLRRVSNDSATEFLQHVEHPTVVFLARWMHSPVSGESWEATGSCTSQPSLYNNPGAPIHTERISVDTGLSKRVDKFLQRWEHDQAPDKMSVNASDVLALLEYKIQELKSREDVLETNAFANAEALASAHRLLEHYRERLAITEAESRRLRALQLEALARLEADQRTQQSFADRLDRSNAEIVDLRAQLAQLQKEYQDVNAKCDSLQSKLTAAREQNRAMDLTIDDYRRQLDQAKEQIQQQTVQITKFTQITRLINDLTGNPAADVSTVNVPSGDGIPIAGQCATSGLDSTTVPGSDTVSRVTSCGTRRTTSRSTRR